MAADRTETLASLIGYLDELDRHIGALLEANCERIVQTDAHVRDSFAELADYRERRPTKSSRENGSFLRSRSDQV